MRENNFSNIIVLLSLIVIKITIQLEEGCVELLLQIGQIVTLISCISYVHYTDSRQSYQLRL